MMFHVNAPASLCFDAFAAAVFVIDRLPSFPLGDKSPFELLFDSPPNYAIFKPFGCRVFPYLRDYVENKLAPRSRPCIFWATTSSIRGFVVLIWTHLEYSPHVMLSLMKLPPLFRFQHSLLHLRVVSLMTSLLSWMPSCHETHLRRLCMVVRCSLSSRSLDLWL